MTSSSSTTFNPCASSVCRFPGALHFSADPGGCGGHQQRCWTFGARLADLVRFALSYSADGGRGGVRARTPHDRSVDRAAHDCAGGVDAARGRRPWMRALGWSALATVVMQGILGGITVLFRLPPAVSTAHATLGQTFFCIVVSMALFTGRGWAREAPVLIAHSQRPRLATLSVLAVCSVYVQLILGAAFRHSGMKLLPHLVSAVVVTVLLLWTSVRVLSRYGGCRNCASPRRRCWCCCLCSSRSGSARILRGLNGAKAGRGRPWLWC